MSQVIEMYSVTGDDCMIARVVARTVEELAEILQRLSMFADSRTSVILETIIPLRNPIPAQQQTVAPPQLAAAAKVMSRGGSRRARAASNGS
jgi:DNA-binding Lrp family transcriptional regulator